MKEVIRPIKAQAEQLGVTLSCNFLTFGQSHSSSMEWRDPSSSHAAASNQNNQDVLSSIVSRGASNAASAIHDLDVISKVSLKCGSLSATAPPLPNLAHT